MHRYTKFIKFSAWTIVAIVVLQWVLGLVGTYFANRALTQSLAAPAKIDRISLNLSRGTLVARGLTIGQPDGFEAGNLIRIGKLIANVSMLSLVNQPLTVSQVLLEGAEITLLVDSNGILNASRLVLLEEDTEKAPTSTVEAVQSSFELLVEQANVKDLSFSYFDASGNKSTNAVEICITNLTLSAENILYSNSKAAVKDLISKMDMDARIIFRDMPPAYASLAARIGAISSEIPGLAASLTVTGLELDSVDPLIPAGVVSTLGGDVLDLTSRLQLFTNVLSLKANAITAGADLPIGIGGTPDDPKIENGAILLSAFGRLGDLFGNTVMDAAGVGVDIGKGAVGMVGAVGKGTGNIVLGVGKGLVDTTVSAAKLDVKGVGQGLAESVSSVGKGAVSTVTDVGSNVVQTASDAGSTALGGKRAEEWRAGKAARHTNYVAQANAWVAAATFPSPAGADTK